MLSVAAKRLYFAAIPAFDIPVFSEHYAARFVGAAFGSSNGFGTAWSWETSSWPANCS